MRTGLSYVAGALAATVLFTHSMVWADPAPVPAKPETTSDDKGGLTWYKAESDHFIVYSDQSRTETERRLKALEQFRFFATKLVPATPGDLVEPKLTLYLVDNSQWLSLIDSRDVAGLYIACREGVSAFSANQDVSFDKNLKMDPNRPRQDLGQTVLFHEYTHHAMFRSGMSSYPLWYIEGMAEFLSTFTYDGQKGVIGDPPYADNWVLTQVNWGQWDHVLAPDERLSSGLATRDGADPVIFYAKAWLLTHYMMSDPSRAKSLQAYFEQLRKGGDPVKTFAAATGIDPLTELPKRLRSYSHALIQSGYSLPDMPDFKVEVMPMEPTANTYMIAAASLRTCLPPARGEWILKMLKLDANATELEAKGTAAKSDGARASWERLKAQAPELAKNEQYRMAVAYGEVLYGDPKAALVDLSSFGPNSALYAQAQYQQGRAWLALATRASGAERAEDLSRAVGLLEKAYTLSPDDGPTLYFLARAYEGRPDFPNDNAINAALGASDAMPSVYDYAAYAAWLELLKGDRDYAMNLLRPFGEDPHARDHAKSVTEIISAISQGKSAAEVKTMMDALDKNNGAEK
ncbi:MAG: hypothetical protein QM647_11700 [Asticcacaulis sp.]|uniref:hypothetical protein n=1 Tax=Asticcacaulis sp. TaxID=1872648 RepID=UPI0039E7229C